MLPLEPFVRAHNEELKVSEEDAVLFVLLILTKPVSNITN